MAYGKEPFVEAFEEEFEWNIKILANNLDLLDNPKDRAFAKSLVDYNNRFDSLTPKQMFRAAQFWVTVNSLGAVQANLTKGVRTGVRTPTPTPTPTLAPTEVKVPVVVIDGKKLLEKFDLAAKELKYPSVEYKISNIEEGEVDTYDGKFMGVACSKILFYRTGAGSKQPGSILVTDGVKYPNTKIFAQVRRDGTTAIHMNIWPFPQFQQFLKKIIENPDEEFALNGKRFANCCFCGKELTTKESLHVGYGPICAEKWGLPWGEDGKEVVKLEDII